jgi:membrane fusion protein (multidrug efflux system)
MKPSFSKYLLTFTSLCGLLSPTVLLANDADTNKQLPGVIYSNVDYSDISPAFNVIGRIQATERVEILSRVSGFLEERLFDEGRSVKAGDVLFRIEQASYKIQKQQAQAELAGAKAGLKNAEAELKRSQQLRKKGASSVSEVELAEANRDKAKAQVMLAQAGLDSAILNLSYTEIKTPISGRISKASFSVGNFISTTSGVLATVVTTHPVYVESNISEKLMIEARRQGLNLENPPVAPSLVLSDGSLYEHKGQFEFVSPEVDINTDTILIRASFPNEGGLLLPGEFVSVRIAQKNQQPIIAVTQSAIQKDNEGYYVLVIDRENKVEVRKVQLGIQEKGLWEVTAGLNIGERIVVEGLQKVQPGMKVNAVEQTTKTH